MNSEYNKMIAVQDYPSRPFPHWVELKREEAPLGWSFFTRQIVLFCIFPLIDFPLIIPNLYFQYKMFSQIEEANKVKKNTDIDVMAENMKKQLQK